MTIAFKAICALKTNAFQYVNSQFLHCCNYCYSQNWINCFRSKKHKHTWLFTHLFAIFGRKISVFLPCSQISRQLILGVESSGKLTSQLPNIIVIGSNTKRSKTRRGNTEIRFVLQRNEITKANIYLLQLLDVIKSIKSIPDSSIDKSCARLLVLLTELSERQTTTLIRFALLYPPRVIALLGAMLQQIGCKSDLNVLRNKLNPISSYNYGISQTVLLFSQQWKIK